MSKILIFSDLHAHCHKKRFERMEDCVKVLDWILKTAIERNIKNVVFCGDLFHDRQKIDVQTYQRVFESFQKHSSKSPKSNVYLLLGNHDLWHYEKWDISSVFPLAAIPTITVVDRPCSIPIDGHEVGFLPYTHNPIEDLKNIVIKGSYKILFGHVAVDGAYWNTNAQADVSIEHDGEMTKITPKVFKAFDQVFLGHYHAEQIMDDFVEYVGSPLELNFGEANQEKHIIEYDLITHNKHYIKNNFSPKHLILKENEVTNFNLENNFIRILTHDLASASIIELRNEISKQNVGSIEIKPILKRIEDDKLVVEEANSMLSLSDQLLEKFVDNQELKGLDRAKLLDFGRECIK